MGCSPQPCTRPTICISIGQFGPYEFIGDSHSGLYIYFHSLCHGGRSQYLGASRGQSPTVHPGLGRVPLRVSDSQAVTAACGRVGPTSDAIRDRHAVERGTGHWCGLDAGFG